MVLVSHVRAVDVRYPERIEQHMLGFDVASILKGAGRVWTGNAFTGENDACRRVKLAACDREQHRRALTLEAFERPV
jgi:hypothetical protein